MSKLLNFRFLIFKTILIQILWTGGLHLFALPALGLETPKPQIKEATTGTSTPETKSEFESSWLSWKQKITDEALNPETSFLAVIDTVFIKHNERAYFTIHPTTGNVARQKKPTRESYELRYGREILLTLPDHHLIHLSKLKSWTSPSQTRIELGKFDKGQVKIYFKNPKAKLLNEFTSFDFYPFNPNFILKAKLDWFAHPKTVTLHTSGGSSRKYLEIGRAHFKIKEKSLSLPAFGIIDQHPLKTLLFFFRDQTSNNTTYGGGRNLEVDLSHPKAKELTLDFNRAFNPYCARSIHYHCAFSEEKPLDVAIEAGEKKPLIH